MLEDHPLEGEGELGVGGGGGGGGKEKKGGGGGVILGRLLNRGSAVGANLLYKSSRRRPVAGKNLKKEEKNTYKICCRNLSGDVL